jgi:hypothetical protein
MCAEVNLVHGRSGKRTTKLYAVWCSIRSRCECPTDTNYAYYGARGIKRCERWSDFRVFEAWALASGYAHGLSIDRIDSDGDYSPENCRWVNAKAQARNRSSNRVLSFRGKTATLAEHAAEAGMKPGSVSYRINSLGWSIEKALTAPLRRSACAPSRFSG